MSAPWWGRESSPNVAPLMTPGIGPARRQPELHPAKRGDVLTELLARVAAYTPEWTNIRDGDAGYALARLFDELTEPVLERLNDLPAKAFIEFLDSAGISPLPASPASALLAFTAAQGAPASILVAEGFQVSGTSDAGDTVVFETERSFFAAPLTLSAAYRSTGAIFEEIALDDEDGEPWRPFGRQPAVGAALLVGLDGPVAPRPSCTLGFVLSGADGAPPPFATGGSETLAPPVTALLEWDAFDNGSFDDVAVIRDGTRGLTQTGVVELRVPDRWRAGRPDGVDTDEPLFWLRLRLAHGELSAAPRVKSLHLNAVEAEATRTIRNEVLEYVPGSDRRQLRLSQTPVFPGSLVLAVDEGGATGSNVVTWEETTNLALHEADDRVYLLDPEDGIVKTGNGVHGMALPRGFRHVTATSYQVGGGASSRLDAESITALVRSLPFLTGVVNPLEASGGADAEPRERTLSRGPQQIRARNRAVTLADYELLALQAPGASVERAHAVATADTRFPGAVIPGSVAVSLVSQDRREELPLADAGSLEAVAEYLTREVAPAGVQVVTSTPRFHRVSVRASVAVSEGADVGTTIQAALQAFQDYLHPLIGGEEGDGWPFGGVIRHQALVRMLLSRVPAVRAVTGLNLVVDGVLRERCEDYALTPGALIWPSAHEAVPEAQ